MNKNNLYMQVIVGILIFIIGFLVAYLFQSQSKVDTTTQENITTNNSQVSFVDDEPGLVGSTSTAEIELDSSVLLDPEKDLLEIIRQQENEQN